jgi:hypothetical protein
VCERRNSRQLKWFFLLPKAANAWKRANEQTDPRRLKSPVLYFTAVVQPVRRVETPAFSLLDCCNWTLALPSTGYTRLPQIFWSPGHLSHHSHLLRAGLFGDRIPAWARFSALVQTSPWAHSWYQVSFTGLKRSGRCVDHPLPLNAEVKDRVELYISISPQGLHGVFYSQ